MAAPPDYGPRRKSNTTTIVLVVIGICAVCCVLGVGGSALFAYFGFQRAKPMFACVVGFGEASEALHDYVMDHDGKLPKAETWQNDIRPYFKKRFTKDQEQGAKMFGSFEPDGVWVCKDQSGQGQDTGIAFNSDLSGLKLSDIKDKSKTFILFEVPKVGSNLNMPYVELNPRESPRFMGNPRGWLNVNADFELGGADKKHTKITFSSNDDN